LKIAPEAVTPGTGRPFQAWLASELRANRMTQRELARRCGVHHSTISKLVRGRATPSLHTATLLLRSLRLSLTDTLAQEQTDYVLSAPARVEHALRRDEVLSDAGVRRVMTFYLGVRRGQ